MRKKIKAGLHRILQPNVLHGTGYPRGFPSFQQDFITMKDWNCGHIESGQLNTDVVTQEHSTV